MIRSTIIVLFILLWIPACSQHDPLALAQAIFGKTEFPNLKNHVTGEYEGRPNGTDLKQSVTTTFEVLEQNDKTAVIAMTITDAPGKEFDVYIHFV